MIRTKLKVLEISPNNFILLEEKLTPIRYLQTNFEDLSAFDVVFKYKTNILKKEDYFLEESEFKKLNTARLLAYFKSKRKIYYSIYHHNPSIEILFENIFQDFILNPLKKELEKRGHVC